ncbi:RNA-directed DNA polymerase, eukaryota, reverse transcriptase zinc-binding domain protein [Tanacetum coccineum]
MVASNPNPNGWTWVFGKNNKQHSKPIDDSFVKDVKKIATSFYVSNFPNSLDAKNLWKEFRPFGRIFDAFIANKRSKQGPIYNTNDVTSRAGNEDVSFSTDQVKVNHTVTHKDMAADEVVLDNSKPPGFKKFIKENKACSWSSSISRAGKCSTSFANYSRKDLKGFSFIDEMNQMIEVGGALSYDVKGCKKSLRRLINGIDHIGRVILFGDLNEVRSESERFGSTFSCGDATIFNSFIHDTGLIDFPMGGRHFTWVNKVGSKMSKFEDLVKEKWAAISDLEQYKPLNTKLKDLKSYLKLWKSQMVQGIMLDGVWNTKPKDIKSGFLDFYKDKFSCHDSLVFFPPMLPAHRLSIVDQDFLESMVIWMKLSHLWFAFSLLIIQGHRLYLSPEQSAFITGWQILDDPLILSETVDWYKKRKKKMMIFKVDFKKSFDSVSWRYLDYVLDKLGFSIKWRNWIKDGLASARTSILINGSPTSEFSLKRGLRQGDPLSPFLFIIVIEGLHMVLNDGLAANMFHGVKVPEMVVKSLKSLRASFFWGSSEDSKKLVWVKWSNSLASLDKGGLGVGNLKVFNMSLLLKWRWRLFHNPNALWVHVVKAIHGDEVVKSRVEYSGSGVGTKSLDRSMDSDKYLEGQSMQRPPLFESDSFIYWKNIFETYAKSKDLDLWHVITNGDFQPLIQNLETKLDEVVPFEKQSDDLKRRLAKNNEAKHLILDP